MNKCDIMRKKISVAFVEKNISQLFWSLLGGGRRGESSVRSQKSAPGLVLFGIEVIWKKERGLR